MIFADFRIKKTYLFEPSVVGRIDEDADGLYYTFVSGDIIASEEDKIVVLATEHGKAICHMLKRDFPDKPIILMSENEAVAEYPKATICRCPPPQEIRDAILISHPETNESANKISMIIPNLYISNEYFSSRKQELASLNICRIVNVTEKCPNYFPDDFQYLRVPVRDQIGAEINRHFYTASAFIDAGLKEGGVLVHCSAGISRSPTIVASYLMIKYGITSEQALNVLRIHRDIVDVNFGFACSLMMFEKELK